MTLDEFWPYYLSQHLNPTNRKLHFAGTTFGLLMLTLAVATAGAAFLLIGLVGSYGLAWIGHFFYEKNSPATFQEPALSFRADFRMYALMWSGGLEAELERLRPTLAELRR